MNEKQKHIIKEVFHYTLNKAKSNYAQQVSQLLLYIRGEKGVRKSHIVNNIEMKVLLLSQQSNLVIAALTAATADNIGGSTKHSFLKIRVCNSHKN